MAGAGLAWKVVGAAATITAGIAARKIVTATWTAATGKEPPTNPEAPGVDWQEAVAWAAISGVVVALARLAAAKKAAEYWERSTGNLPPGLEEVDA